jgi:hypothetical protein
VPNVFYNLVLRKDYGRASEGSGMSPTPSESGQVESSHLIMVSSTDTVHF